jgi:RHS repeat-associated protein
VIPRTATGPKPQSEWTYTIYERDAHGEIDWKEQISLQEQYIYGSDRLGLRHGLQNVSMCFHVNDPAVLQDGYQLFTNPDYESFTLVYSEDKSNLDLLPYEKSVILVSIKTYEFTDHLGNVSATISDRKITIAVAAGNAVASYAPEVLSEKDYFPFGMGMMNRSMTAENYEYGFNGKEDDDEWGIQDYGFRLYNPSIAKFISVDPLTKDYPWYTPYQFAGNKPIWAVDLDGLEEFIRTQWFVPGPDGTPTLWKTEIQVVKAGENHTAVQLVHQNVNIVDALGNVSTRYIGTTVGTRNPSNAANGSTAFNANENAAIWNVTPTMDTAGNPTRSFDVTQPNQGKGQIETQQQQLLPGGAAVRLEGEPQPSQPQGMVVINQPGVAGPANMAPVPTGLHNTPANPAQRINITNPGAPIPSMQTGAPLNDGSNAGKMLVNTNDMNKPTLRPVGTGQQKTMNNPNPGIPLVLRYNIGLTLTIF